jgi:protocatechuate 3,4-dioxygenase alpha subunit
MKNRLGQTPWQTVGPFFHYGLPWRGGADLIGDTDIGARVDLCPPGHFLLASPRKRSAIAGDVIEISGAVLDGAGAPVPDAMVEIWQANAAGRYAAPQDTRGELALDKDFIGFGRSSTDAEGVFRFRTVRPGRVPGPGNTLQAPHVAISVLGRGLLKRLATRLYFADSQDNDTDPILSLVPDARRATLIARSEGANTYRFDIVLQGQNETVFFDI